MSIASRIEHAATVPDSCSRVINLGANKRTIVVAARKQYLAGRQQCCRIALFADCVSLARETPNLRSRVIDLRFGVLPFGDEYFAGRQQCRRIKVPRVEIASGLP